VTIQEGDAAASGELPRLAAEALTGAAQGWTFADGTVTVKVADGFSSLHLQIQNQGKP
jgi:hypothetical protein